MNEVYAFDVWVKDTNWHKTVNERTPGRAKREYHRDVTDAWPDVPYTVSLPQIRQFMLRDRRGAL